MGVTWDEWQKIFLIAYCEVLTDRATPYQTLNTKAGEIEYSDKPTMVTVILKNKTQ